MDKWIEALTNLKASPALRSFLRSELASALLLTGPGGEKWSYLAVQHEIQDSPEFPGDASDDTIRRLLEGYDTRLPGLQAIGGFLLRIEAITLDDLRRHDRPIHERSAIALQYLLGISESGDLPRPQGGFVDYRLVGKNALLSTRLVVSSVGDGVGWTVTQTVSVHIIEDLDFFLEETDNLNPSLYPEVPSFLAEQVKRSSMSRAAYGVMALTNLLAFWTVEPTEYTDEGLFAVTEWHREAEKIVGFRAKAVGNWQDVVEGHISSVPRAGAQKTPSRFSDATYEFYPQEIRVDAMPKFGAKDVAPVERAVKGDRLGFMAPSEDSMGRKEDLIAQAEEMDIEAEAALLACANETERLSAAIDLLRVEDAVKAVENGADVNANHARTGAPFIHTAASFGMWQLVDAILDTGVCDLTVRDDDGRLASACADMFAEDFELRDKLVALEIKQFRERGIDPRRPTAPNYGSLILPPETE